MIDDDRPRCACHDEPMYRNGRGGHGAAQFVCARRARERNALRVEACAAGLKFYVGHAPTREGAMRLRRKIKEEAPRGTVRDA